MPFPTKLLNENEEVILDLRPHWSRLAKTVSTLVVAIVATIALSFVNHLATLAMAVVVVLALGWFAVTYLKWTTTNFVVTTDRLVYRSGIVAKHGKEIPLERVNDISFSQTIVDRLLGTGDLSIESAGAGSRETFADIPHPSLVQNEIYAQMEAAAGRHADRLSGRRDLSLPEQLEKLDELRQRGVLTQAEFEAKKRQLLDRF